VRGSVRAFGHGKFTHILFVYGTSIRIGSFTAGHWINTRITGRDWPDWAWRLRRASGQRQKSGEKQDWQGPADAQCCR
jgi:hypothetical protein